MTNKRIIELLEILQEECAEVIQAVSKFKRFGAKTAHGDNIEHIHIELGDVMGVIKELADEKFIKDDMLISAAEAKVVKLDKFMVNKKPK